jgi:hypothetical protein
MEVHNHVHPIPGHKKKWTHYFWEFLMLFLAVFCGFLAENKREHIIEHRREIQFMHSMLDDLKTDIAMFETNISLRTSRLQMIDSLITLLSSSLVNGNMNEAYFYARNISPPTNIFSTDGTVQQLKSAGNLRLIRNREIANRILAYDQEVRQVIFEMSDEVEIRAEYRQLASKLFDTKIFADMQQDNRIVMPTHANALFSNDAGLINQFIGTAQYLKKVHTTQRIRTQKLKSMAEELSKMIAEVYH